MGGHEFDHVRAHDFRNRYESKLVADPLENLKPLFGQTLERIRRCSRLKRSAAQNRGTGLLYGPGSGAHLALGFHRTGSRHHNETFAYTNALNLNDVVVAMPLPARQFVRVRRLGYFAHAGKRRDQRFEADPLPGVQRGRDAYRDVVLAGETIGSTP